MLGRSGLRLALLVVLVAPAAGFLPQAVPLALKGKGGVGLVLRGSETQKCIRQPASGAGFLNSKASTTTLDLEQKKPLVGILGRCWSVVQEKMPLGKLKALRVHNRLNRHEKRLLGSRRLHKWMTKQHDKMWGTAVASTRDSVVLEAEEMHQRELQMMQLRSMAFLNSRKRLTEVNLLMGPKDAEPTPEEMEQEVSFLVMNSKRAQEFLDKHLEGVPDLTEDLEADADADAAAEEVEAVVGRE
mmetsp:Transcript_16084/g.24960  ORF Transcript_16084/g.24960 Transcript_16084/m.24960 type:complete len:243 (-) Transcript_16084:269-997(-)